MWKYGRKNGINIVGENMTEKTTDKMTDKMTGRINEEMTWTVLKLTYVYM